MAGGWRSILNETYSTIFRIARAPVETKRVIGLKEPGCQARFPLNSVCLPRDVTA